MRLQLTTMLLGFALTATSLAPRSPRRPSDDTQPFKVTAEIISQKYCPTNETEYTIIFKLRMRFTNQTDRKLIVDKGIGRGVYDILIASDAKNFSDGKFEFSPITDRDSFFIGPDGKEAKENFDTPDPNFVIMAPGDSFGAESVFNAYGVGPLYGFPARRGSLPPGNHVFGIWISVWWPYHARPEDVRKQWESFGTLFTKAFSSALCSSAYPRFRRLRSATRNYSCALEFF